MSYVPKMTNYEQNRLQAAKGDELTPEALTLEEALQSAASLSFGATWHGIAKRQMMAHGICRTITDHHRITRELLDRLSSGDPLERTGARVAVYKLAFTLLELAGEALDGDSTSTDEGEES